MLLGPLVLLDLQVRHFLSVPFSSFQFFSVPFGSFRFYSDTYFVRHNTKQPQCQLETAVLGFYSTSWRFEACEGQQFVVKPNLPHSFIPKNVVCHVDITG